MPFKAKKVTPIDDTDLESLGRSVMDLAAYTEDEFATLASALQSTEAETILFSAPPKPRAGTIVYADGVNWNPGAGEGPYYYSAALTWIPMKNTFSGAGYLPLGGGTMTGAIVLPGNPANPLEAAPKQYVDTAVSGSGFAPLASPVFTGDPRGPTPAQGDADISFATTAFVNNNGCWVLLKTITASGSATLADTTSFALGFDEYEIVFDDIITAVNNAGLILQVRSGGAFKNTGYISAATSNNGSSVSQVAATNSILLSLGAAMSNAAPAKGSVRVGDPSVSRIHVWDGTSTTINAGVANTGKFGGCWNTAAALDGFQVLASSGNITSGTVKVYGRM